MAPALNGFATEVVSIVGAALCIGLRVAAMRFHWHLRVARPGVDSATGPD